MTYNFIYYKSFVAYNKDYLESKLNKCYNIVYMSIYKDKIIKIRTQFECTERKKIII